MKTIKLIDQIKASQALYAAELARYDELTDDELDRVLGVASGSTIDRVLGVASGSTIARVLGVASDSTTIVRLNVEIPIIENLDQRIYEVTKDGANFDMGTWACGMTHCRGGWAIDMAGEAGAKLVSLFDYEPAARMIYEASTGRLAPNFYASNKDALADIARCAGVQA